MYRTLTAVLCLALAASGCALDAFRTGKPGSSPGHGGSNPQSGSAPVLTSAPPVTPPVPGEEPAIAAPPPTQLPHERPKVPAATLGPASKALVAQAQTQRKKGDLPGATVTLERALRIEPNNPLLWIEMGSLRMDQRSYAQAEGMGRKALAMSVGDDRTQSQAWQLIADSLRARGKNSQAQEALEHAKALSAF
jgi:tetratricopeptide (TPR) repeat protein